jgi:hypothetical protein
LLSAHENDRRQALAALTGSRDTKLNHQESRMLKRGIPRLAIAAVTIASAIGFTSLGAVGTGTAFASSTGSFPTTTAASGFTAASCNAVGYVYEEQINQNVTFCGLGYYYRPKGGWTIGGIFPYTNNRWWLHENGKAYCIRDKDFLHGIPSGFTNPVNILVSSNTSAC